LMVTFSLQGVKHFHYWIGGCGRQAYLF